LPATTSSAVGTCELADLDRFRECQTDPAPLRSEILSDSLASPRFASAACLFLVELLKNHSTTISTQIASSSQAKPGRVRRGLQRFLPRFARPFIDSDGYFSPNGFLWPKSNHHTKLIITLVFIIEQTTGQLPPLKVSLLKARHVAPKVDEYYLHNDKATPVLSAINCFREF